MQRHLCRQPGQPLRRPLDLRDAGQEGEQSALLLLGQRAPDRGSHLLLDPPLRAPGKVTQLDRMGAALAFDHGRIFHQRRETRAVQRCRHSHQPQVGPERALRVKRKRESEIAVEAAFMHLVE